MLAKVGQIELAVPQHEHPDRTGACEVRVGSVTLAPPDCKGRSSLTPLTFAGIVVTEQQDPSEKHEPIEWKLLTNIPTTSFAEALVIIRYDRLRWQVEICQSQPIKMAWSPLRLVIATIIYLRGLVKREDIGDVDLFPCNHDFFDQTLGHGLAISK